MRIEIFWQRRSRMSNLLDHFLSHLLSVRCEVSEDSLGGVMDWLDSGIGSRTCASPQFHLLSTHLVSLLSPLILLSSGDPDEGLAPTCTGLLLTAPDVWHLDPLLTPSRQKLFIFSDIYSIEIPHLRGRQAVIGSCNSSYFYVKTEFETHLRQIPIQALKENLPGEEISKSRTVILGTYNLSIFSAFGPLHLGKPEWIDGVEMLGVTAVLESFGLPWTVLPTGSLGKVYPDGSVEPGKFKWSMKTGRADIGFGSYWPDSKTISDIVNPWHMACTKLLVPRPRYTYPCWYCVFRPLPWEFWLALILANLLTAALITLLYYLRPQRTAKLNGKFIQSFFIALTFISLGTGSTNKLLEGLRPLQVGWAVFILIVSAAYSSSLASILTTPTVEELPQSLAQLYLGGYVWLSGFGPLDNPELLFQTNSKFDKKWLKREVPMMSKLLPGKTALLGEDLNGIFVINTPDEFTERYLKSLIASRECLAAHHLSIVTRRMSPYFELMNSGFSRLAESGVLKKIIKDSTTSPRISKFIVRDAYKKDDIRRFTPLGLASLRGAFYILTGGLSLSLVLFLFEKLMDDLRRKKIKKHQRVFRE